MITFFFITKFFLFILLQRKMGGLLSTETLDERIDNILTIRQLKAEIESLKADNNALRKEMMTELNRSASRDVAESKQPSVVSQAAIDLFVETLLANPTTNLGMVPDFIERPGERQVFGYLLGALAKVFDSAKIELVGHEVLMHMRPKQTESPERQLHFRRSEELAKLSTAFDSSAVALHRQ